MIYSRLPVLFLGTIISEKYGAGNAAIAATILKHLDEAGKMGIQELAGLCNVSVSSISRFCTQIGLSGFAELKEILMLADLSLQMQSDAENQAERISSYEDNALNAIRRVSCTLDLTQLSRLLDDLERYERISLFGLLKAQSAALSLASDLLFCGKNVYSNVSFAEQMKVMKNANHHDLILIFSYTGSYFEDMERNLFDQAERPKIWMISGREVKSPLISENLTFESRLDQASHPYQLLYAATVIAQEMIYRTARRKV